LWLSRYLTIVGVSASSTNISNDFCQHLEQAFCRMPLKESGVQQFVQNREAAGVSQSHPALRSSSTPQPKPARERSRQRLNDTLNATEFKSRGAADRDVGAGREDHKASRREAAARLKLPVPNTLAKLKSDRNTQQADNANTNTGEAFGATIQGKSSSRKPPPPNLQLPREVGFTARAGQTSI
jgi:hypothetical protein